MPDRDEKGRWLVGHAQPGPGRDRLFEPWMVDQAHKFALLGMTDEEIAAAFNVHVDTIYRWMKDYDAFYEAIHRGKEPADAEIAASLFNRARGMTLTSEKAFKNKEGEVVVAQMKTQIAPDTKAAAIWLANRQRRRWFLPAAKDGDEGQAAGAITDMTEEQIEAELATLRARRGEE